MMLRVGLFLERDGVECGRAEEVIGELQEQEMRFLTIGALMASEREKDVGNPGVVWECMARVFLGCSSLGMDVMLEEYGKKRVRIKKAEARELVP